MGRTSRDGLCAAALPGIETDDFRSTPRARRARPALWVTPLGSLIDALASLEDRIVNAGVPLVGSDEADGAVEVDAVVPGDETIDPEQSLFGRGERRRWVCRAVLQGSEQSLAVWVVIADARP